MLLRFIKRSTFSNQSNSLRGVDSNLEEVLAKRQKIRREILRKETENLPIEQSIRSYYDSIVNITFYMRFDDWRSQYLYLMLNYNKLGFRKISDLVSLDRASYFLELRKIKESERWPSIKVVVALEPKVILTGITAIDEFFRENGYFIQQVDKHGGQVEALQSHIDNEILPHMESLFWHPKLTYMYSFHTNLSSYIDTSKNYNIFGILRRNFTMISSRVLTNLLNIAREPEKYSNSKGKFTQSIKQLEKIYLSKTPFLGGERPNHVDFYLLSHLKTKGGCGLFVDYLEKGIGGQFWRWWIRMSNLCQYNPDRITTL